MKKLLPLIFGLFTSCITFAQGIPATSFTASYPFTGVSTTSGRTDPTPVPVATGVVFSAFSATGTPANPNAGGRFSFTNWPLGAVQGSNTFTGAINTSQYYQVTVTPAAGGTFSVNSIDFKIQRSGTGIRQYVVRSSVDGYTSNLPASISPASASLSVTGSNVFQIDDANTSATAGSKVTLDAAYTNLTTPLTFRFYGFNAEASGGTFSIDDVNLNGASGSAGTDATPPVNLAGFPKIENISTASADLISSLDEAGTTYYVLIPATGVAPTTTLQIKAGQDGSGAGAFKSGSFAISANTNASTTISGLGATTAYEVYVVSQDAASTPNLQTAFSTLSFATANPTPTVSPVIISQFYEGGSVNKWIELTNLSNSPVNTASPQLKLALYNISGDAGTMNITATPSQTVNLNVTIPANGTVLIGNSGNGNEVSYLTAASAAQASNAVINFNGNDGVALLDANNNILDAFGQGINAKDASYVRNSSVTGPSPAFIAGDWTLTDLQVVQNAEDLDDPNRLGVHVLPNYPDCLSPANQPTALAFSAVGTKSITLSFNLSATAGEYLIVRSLNSSLSAVPADGTVYNAGSSLGGGTVAGRMVGNSFTDSNLPSGSTFYYFIYALNSISCNGGPKYLSVNPLSGSQATNPLPVCAAPVSQATNFNISFSNYNVIQGSFTPATGADEFLVVMSKDSTLSALPLNQATYAVGDSIGGGIVIKKTAQGNFSRNGLAQNTDYFFYIFSVNSNCSGGPLYLTSAPLTGRQRTAVFNSNAQNFYFGNLHAHSSYSDGNKDDTTKTPVDDYTFAKNSMNMDFLGLSEHNHTQAGMRLASWLPGQVAAANATTPDFVALHGMEWGVIKNGGHVIVYGVDSLIGWEPGEHQVYVPKSIYTGNAGLFNAINRQGLNAVATLAHPNTSDYNNIAATYDSLADSAIVGTALASGPAFSTNVSYTDPASSMSYLSYYNRMLAKGYHLGASIDHDNHNMTFGRHTRARLVVLAPALTENDLLDGLKKMRFYASEDSAAKITYTINGQPVGSIFTGNGVPKISVSGATTSPVTSISIIYGQPGTGITPATLVSSSTATLTYSDSTLAHLATGYYYADIKEADGSRIITSPIWYTRNDSLKTAQSITFNPLPGKTYGDPDFDPAAASSNNTIPVMYASSDTTIATIVGGKVHISRAGSVFITASQAGNSLYKPAASKTQTLSIAPKAISASIQPKEKEYGAPDPELTYTFSAALVSGDSFTGSLSRTPGENTGIYPINAGTLALNSNYTLTVDTSILTITKKDLTITADNKTRAYGSPNPVFTASYNGFVYGDEASVLTTAAEFSTTATEASPVGTYPVVVAGASAVNYTISYAPGTLTVNQASATLTLSNLTQANDGTEKPVTVSTSPPGLTGVSITYNGSPSPPVAVGTYSVSAELINSNYTAIPVSGTLTITQQQILKVQYRNADKSLTDKEGKPQLKIVNAGTAAVDYNQLTARYWITPENFTGSLGMWIDYAALGTNKVTMRYVPLASPKLNALGYIEYGFTPSAGSLAGGANSGEIQSRYANTDWTAFNEANDHSIGTNNSYADKTTITLYRNGVLIWGTEPVAEAPVTRLKIYAESKSSGNSNTISTTIDIRNEGNVPVDYRDITARYWFTSEGTSPLKFWIDYAKIGNSAISGSFVTLSPVRTNANTYLELKASPVNSTFYPLSATGNIQYRVSKSDWSAFNQLNDHSFKTGSMAENSKITIYYQGQLVYGTEPDALTVATYMSTSIPEKASITPERAESSSTIVYPNPSFGNFTLTLGDNRSGAFKATIYNSAGKPLDTYSGNKTGSFSKEYQLQLSKGMYYMIISWKEQTDYKTILIN